MPERKIASFAVTGDALHSAKVIACDYRYQPTALKITVYGMREFSLSDPDGHRPSFGQDENE